jgi:hypothetical protein
MQECKLLWGDSHKRNTSQLKHLRKDARDLLSTSPNQVHQYRSGAKYRTLVQYLLLVSNIFEVLDVPIHGGNELETFNCNERHNEPCKNIIQHRGICWCNDK